MKSAYIELYEAAVALVTVLDRSAEQLLPQEIVDVVKLHSKLAVGSAIIPVPGADAAAGAVNIWTMYSRIGNKVGIAVKENKLKTIGSGVLTNLVSYTAMIGVGSAVKAIPGIGTLTGIALMSASLYAITLASGYVYVKALTLLANQGDGDIDLNKIDLAIKEVLGNKEIIKKFVSAAKADFKKNKEEITKNV